MRLTFMSDCVAACRGLGLLGMSLDGAGAARSQRAGQHDQSVTGSVSSEVIVERIEPWYGPAWPDGSTGPRPRILAVLTDQAASSVRTIELSFDGEPFAYWIDGLGEPEYIRGDGVATAHLDDGDDTRIVVEYSHSSYARDWLAVGGHDLGLAFESPSFGWTTLAPDAEWAHFRVQKDATSIR